jgi:hypothetical protein
MAGPVATGYLELDLSGFNRAIESAKKALTVLTAAFAAIKVAEFFREGVNEAINFGNEMYNAGKAMGNIDPSVLLIAQKALEGSGLAAGRTREEIEGVMTSQRKFSSLFKTQVDFEKAMSRAREIYGSQAAVLTASAASLSRVFEHIQGIADKLRTFFLAMTAKFVLPLEAVLNALNNVDVADFGSKLGASIASVSTILVGLFQDGKISEAFGLSLAIGADKFFATLGTGIGAVFSGVASDFGKEVALYLTGGGLVSVKDAFVGIADLFVAKILRGVSSIKGLSPFDSKKDEADREKEIKNKEAAADAYFKKYLDAIPGAKGFGEGFTKEGKAAEDALKKLTDSAKISGQAFMEKNAGDRSKSELNYQALGKQDPFSVIASSMAKIGGGGNYIQTGMSAEARQLIINGQAAQLQNELTQQLIDLTKKGLFLPGIPLIN